MALTLVGTGNELCHVKVGFIMLRASKTGLQQTARAATRHGARDPLVRPQVDQTYRGASNLRS